MEFIDLKAQYRALKSEIDANIQAVLDAGQFIGGAYVEALEEKLAAYVGRKHCIACGNGTDALQAAYMALGVGAGTRCSARTSPSSLPWSRPICWAPSRCSATSPRTAITWTPPAWNGRSGPSWPRAASRPRRWWPWTSWQSLRLRRHRGGLREIRPAPFGGRRPEHGASYKGRMCGSFGIVSTTSFFPAKTLGCYGDGGAIFTDDDLLAAWMRSICVHGKGPGGKYDNVRGGVQLPAGQPPGRRSSCPS